MSLENVKKYLEELPKNTQLQKKLNAVGKKYSGDRPAQELQASIFEEELHPLIKEAGYDFTLAEFKDYVAKMTQLKQGAIDDNELTAVAGGSDALICAIVGVDPYNACTCVAAGGGQIPDKYGDVCACVLGGYGQYRS